jgi:hypothetical protein
VLGHVALGGEEAADLLGRRVGLRVAAGDGGLDVVQVAGGGVGRELAPECAPPGVGLAELRLACALTPAQAQANEALFKKVLGAA